MTDETGHWVQRTLDDLAWHWPGAYLFHCQADDQWIATRADNGRTLIAADPAALRQLVRRDYTARPVPRDIEPSAAMTEPGTRHCPVRH